MTGNTSKKKLVVALSVIAVVVVAAIVSVVAVLAAPQQNVKSSVTVTYAVTDVVADVNARYGFLTVGRTDGEPTSYTATNIKGAVGSQVSFSAEEAETSKSLNTDELNTSYPSSTESAVVFEFNFTNKSAKAFTAALAMVQEGSENVVIKYAVKDGSSADDNWHSLTWSDSYTAATVEAANTADSSDELHVYVMAVVEDLTVAATFTADFTWTLAAVA